MISTEVEVHAENEVRAVRKGRPPGPKKAIPKPEVQVEEQEPKEPKKYIFKSKYRDDKFRLSASRKERFADGSMSTVPAVWAQFSQHTWSTYNREDAKLMRKHLKELAALGDRVDIVETTDTEG